MSYIKVQLKYKFCLKTCKELLKSKAHLFINPYIIYCLWFVHTRFSFSHTLYFDALQFSFLGVAMAVDALSLFEVGAPCHYRSRWQRSSEEPNRPSAADLPEYGRQSRTAGGPAQLRPSWARGWASCETFRCAIQDRKRVRRKSFFLYTDHDGQGRLSTYPKWTQRRFRPNAALVDQKSSRTLRASAGV